jgi:cell wall assembly regulator SMI1
MEELVHKLLSILASRTHLNPLPFNAGCSENQIIQAEHALNLTLPNDYKAFLRYSNGQSDSFTLSFPPDQLVFLPIEDVVSLWKELNRDPDHEFFDQLEADGRVRSVLQHPRRIPIAYNEAGGAYLFIDYIPGPNGKEGQLVFNTNEVDCVVIEENVGDLIHTYVRLLESGKVIVTRQPSEYGQGYWFVSSQGQPINWDAYKSLVEDMT